MLSQLCSLAYIYNSIPNTKKAKFQPNFSSGQNFHLAFLTTYSLLLIYCLGYILIRLYLLRKKIGLSYPCLYKVKYIRYLVRTRYITKFRFHILPKQNLVPDFDISWIRSQSQIQHLQPIDQTRTNSLSEKKTRTNSNRTPTGL